MIDLLAREVWAHWETEQLLVGGVEVANGLGQREITIGRLTVTLHGVVDRCCDGVGCEVPYQFLAAGNTNYESVVDVRRPRRFAREPQPAKSGAPRGTEQRLDDGESSTRRACQA
jgi:hypothetical protein